MTPISKGGTGATTLAAAKTALEIPIITAGTTDMIAGTSPLATGSIYMMYE